MLFSCVAERAVQALQGVQERETTCRQSYGTQLPRSVHLNALCTVAETKAALSACTTRVCSWVQIFQPMHAVVFGCTLLSSLESRDVNRWTGLL
jgi:hypothetical protein